jgi:hypothetical protein
MLPPVVGLKQNYTPKCPNGYRFFRRWIHKETMPSDEVSSPYKLDDLKAIKRRLSSSTLDLADVFMQRVSGNDAPHDQLPRGVRDLRDHFDHLDQVRGPASSSVDTWIRLGKAKGQDELIQRVQ